MLRRRSCGPWTEVAVPRPILLTLGCCLPSTQAPTYPPAHLPKRPGARRQPIWLSLPLVLELEDGTSTIFRHAQDEEDNPFGRLPVALRVRHPGPGGRACRVGDVGGKGHGFKSMVHDPLMGVTFLLLLPSVRLQKSVFLICACQTELPAELGKAAPGRPCTQPEPTSRSGDFFAFRRS